MAHHENCRELLGSLSDYVDGTLEDTLCAEIERHLTDCNNCRIVVDTLKKTVFLVREGLEDPALPEDVRQRLFLALNLEEFLKRPE